MNGYSKLAASIVTSSIWTEADTTRIVWITMIAMSDHHGEVSASIPGLARVAGVSIPACEAALATFLAPDAYSRTKDDEGRRIQVIDGGWWIINHGKYRELASGEERASSNAKRQKRHRDKQNRNVVTPTVTDRNATVTDRNAGVTPVCHTDTNTNTDTNTDTNTNTDTKKEKGKVASLPTVDAFELYPNLNTSEFKAAWQMWIDNRKQMKKGLTIHARDLQLAKLAKFGHERAIQSIKLSIENSWTGLFEPKPEPKPEFRRSGGQSTSCIAPNAGNSGRCF
jgi:hypothetical protein